MNVNINDIKNGMTLILEGKLVTIVDFQHVKPGKGPAFVRIKYRDLRTGSTIEDTFNTNLKLEKAHVEKMQMQFLYKENDNYVFMNTNDYSQMEVSSSIIGDDAKFLKEGLVIEIQMYEGEILGIAGLDGSGRTETLETIFGIATRKSGTIKLDGKQVSNKNAQDSIKNGFALLTEERRATGIFGILNIRENTVISSLKRHKKGFYLSEKSMKEDTQKYIDALRTKTPSQETKIRALSGGNQQKVILGRWLLTDPEVLLLDEPTRGIDVGAKYEIYQLIIDLANRGKVVIVVSSEMPELLGICDRIMVMSGGRLAGEIDAEEATQELIMTYAAKYV